MLTRHRWEMTPADAQAVAHEIIRLSEADEEAIDFDKVVAQFAPSARRIEYQVPAAEMDTGDGHMHYPMP